MNYSGIENIFHVSIELETRGGSLGETKNSVGTRARRVGVPTQFRVNSFGVGLKVKLFYLIIIWTKQYSIFETVFGDRETKRNG
jgi:hypothetical protein